MPVSAGHLDALVGFSGPPSDIYGITLSSYATSGVFPSEALTSATVTTTGAGALGTATSASIPETFSIVAVNDTTNTATFTITANFSGTPIISQNTFYALGFAQNAVLFGYSNSNTLAVNLDLNNNLDLILGVLSTAPLPVGTTLSFSANGTYSGSATSAQSTISDLYLSILGRPADSAGLAGWVSAVGAGTTYGQVAAALASSAEAQGDISNSYQAVLGRSADSGGLAGFTGYLANGGSLKGIAAILAGSAEGQADISNTYQAVLGRAADPGGLAGFTGYLAAGGSLSGVRASLAGSAEGQADISNTYQAVLGRPADSGGLAGFTAFLVGNGSLTNIRTILASSAEAQSDVTRLLQADFGRVPAASEVAAGELQLTSGLSLTDLNTQFLELAANPNFIAGSGGVLQGTPGVDVFKFGPGTFGQNVVSGFDPAHDILQLSSSQFANLGAVLSSETPVIGGTQITLNSSNTILIQGLAPSSLVPADFRFG